jgi:AICAR transformylase/IMP cyclohydrolase PurH
MDNERIKWILQGVLLLSEGQTEKQLEENGIPLQYINQIRSVYNMIK